MANQALMQGDYEKIGQFVGNSLEEVLLNIQSTTGFKRSAVFDATIAQNATQSSVIDLGALYGFITVRVTNGLRVQSGAKLRVYAATEAADTLCKLFDVSRQSSDMATVPDGSGLTLQVCLPQVMGARRIQIELSLSASGGSVPIEVYGSDLMSE